MSTRNWEHSALLFPIPKLALKVVLVLFALLSKAQEILELRTSRKDKTMAELQEWHNALAEPDAKLSIPAALTLLNGTSAAMLCRTPLGPGVPTLHWLLNLYFRSREPGARRGLVQILQKCVDSHSADVTERFNNDPSVLVKAMLLREMNLAKSIAGRAQGGLNTNAVFAHLYALPCEVVPLSKLLLHGSTIISKMGLDAVGGIEGFLKLVAGASLGGQSKPAVKGGDLAILSPSYLELVSSAGFGKSNNHLHMSSLLQILDDVASTTHQLLLSEELDEANIASLGEHVDATTKRNSLHALAISGATQMMNQLKEVVARVSAKKTNDAGLQALFLTEDSRGMIPAAYALMRHGSQSLAYTTMLDLCRVAGPATLKACQSRHPEVLLEKTPAGRRTHNTPSATINVDGSSQSSSMASLCAALDGADESGQCGGEWNRQRLQDAGDGLLAGDPYRCDILQVQGPPSSKEEFYRRYVLTNTPVVFRGAALGSQIQRLFRRSTFIENYGNVVVDVGAIPYPGSFGVASSAVTLSMVANQNATAPQNSPSYAFTTPNPRWSKQLRDDCPLPSFVPVADASDEIQFYLGPAGSGAPMHFHGHAVNTLAFGEKRWFIYPPSDAFYSTQPALDFVQSSSPSVSAAWQCTQHSGDIMFVPTQWSHSTLNVKQSIGVAHEFSIEPFCME